MTGLPIQNIINASDLFPAVYEDVLDRVNRGKELSLTSLPTLDDTIWGFRRQKLVVIGGRPAQGKSTVLAQLAFDFAKQGKKVLFFSLEMTNQVCLERLMCNYVGLDNRLITTGRIAEVIGKYSARVNEFSDVLKRSPLILIQSEGRTFPEILNIIEAMDTPIDAVFIDYVQMISTSFGQTRREGIEEYIKQLRNYAIQKNFCAVIGSQINRGTHEGHKIRRPQLWELKEAGALEECADMVLLVFWGYLYDKLNEDIRNDYEIDIAKNRDGQTGVIQCSFYPEYYRLSEKVGYGHAQVRSPYSDD